MKIRVADYIAEFLEKKGIEHAFMLSGGGMMHLQDALSRREKLRYVCNHHEQACGFAAEAYGRQRQHVGLCYATSGPGAANTVTAVVSAYQDSSPVIFLGGQAKVSETIRGTGLTGLRQFGTFEVDNVSILQSITKYAAYLRDPESVRFHMEKAYYLATHGRPGPVYIEVPVDISGALVDPESLKPWDEPVTPDPEMSLADAEDILARLQKAKRPLIFAGHGVRASQSVEAFRQLATALNIPVATTQLAADLLEFDYPLFVGRPGVKGDRAGNFAVQTADLIITVGCSLHSMTTGYELDQFAPKAYKIQVEIDPMVLKRENVGVQKKISASVQSFIATMNVALEKKGISASTGKTLVNIGHWHEHCQMWKRELMVRNEPHPREPGGLSYYDAIEGLSEACQGGETIVADAGCAFYITGQAFRTKKDQRLIFCGALAQMGYTLPATTGACLADPNRTVIGVTGDGSLLTNLHEIGVIAHHNLNAKILIINNDGYSCIRNTQRNYFGAFYSGTDTKSGVGYPDMPLLAKAYGLPYMSARTPEDMKTMLTTALAQKGPAILEIFTIRDQEFMPTVSSVRLENGKMQSKPLHEMYPFMNEETLKRYMTFPEDIR